MVGGTRIELVTPTMSTFRNWSYFLKFQALKRSAYPRSKRVHMRIKAPSSAKFPPSWLRTSQTRGKDDQWLAGS
jgi:hypothetical protein